MGDLLLLRPVLEAALVVAREGEAETPSVPAPAALRPFLRFAKLPPRALAATRRVLDVDDEFRARVAEELSEEDVGQAGRLFLSRPDGWEAELATLVAGAEEQAREKTERRAEHEARRRLGAVQEAARRADAAAAEARAEAVQASAVLGEERRARLVAAEEAAAAARRVEVLTSERDRARSAAAAASKEAEALRGRVASLQARVQELQEAAAARVVPPAPAPPELAPEPDPAPPALAPPAPVVQWEAAAPGHLSGHLGPALSDAAAAAAKLAEALRTAARSLLPDVPSVPEEEPASTSATAMGAAVGQAEPRPAFGPRASGRRTDVPRRRPVALPPAVFDDSPEAAEHLLRTPGIVLVVDGYNVSLAGWPGLSLPEQRRRLVDAVAELAARTGADSRVVFDGSEAAMPGFVPTTSQVVRVSFSPPGVEADEVILGLVSELPAHRPVVVATSDRRVQNEAARAGANVIFSSQLLAVLRR